MYSCRVKGTKAANLLLPALMQLPSIGMIVAVLIMNGPKIPVIIGALVLSGMAIYLALRAQLTEYIYEISDVETPGHYDLIITSVCGKRIRPECRIALSGTLMPVKKAKDGADRPIRLCPMVAERTVYAFDPDEFGGEWRILFCPDEEMMKIMRVLGTRIE